MSSRLLLRPAARAALNCGASAMAHQPRVAMQMTRASPTMMRSSPLLRPAFPAYPQTYRGMSIKADYLEAKDQKVETDADMSIMHFKTTPTKHPLGLTKLNADEGERWWGCEGGSLRVVLMPRTMPAMGQMSSARERGRRVGWAQNDPLHHSVWTQDEVKAVQVTHLEPRHWTGTVAYYTAQFLRFSFDLLAGFKHRVPDEAMWLNRMVFLETVAGVPGMVAAMIRHLHSLRLMTRDHGWIHTLLEEAENERMHLLTFMTLKKPGPFFRLCVVVTQGVFFNGFFLAYLINPRLCHSLVGYIEEEAVKTYTHILQEIDNGSLPLFETAVPPPIALAYWKLPADAKFRDLILAVRADEATHRHVNHTFAALKRDEQSPFAASEKYLVDIKVVELPPIKK